MNRLYLFVEMMIILCSLSGMHGSFIISSKEIDKFLLEVPFMRILIACKYVHVGKRGWSMCSCHFIFQLEKTSASGHHRS